MILGEPRLFTVEISTKRSDRLLEAEWEETQFRRESYCALDIAVLLGLTRGFQVSRPFLHTGYCSRGP